MTCLYTVCKKIYISQNSFCKRKVLFKNQILPFVLHRSIYVYFTLVIFVQVTPLGFDIDEHLTSMITKDKSLLFLTVVIPTYLSRDTC